MGHLIQERPSEICGRQPLKILRFKQNILVQIFKGCLPQISLGPFLNSFKKGLGSDPFLQAFKYIYQVNIIHSKITPLKIYRD